MHARWLSQEFFQEIGKPLDLVARPSPYFNGGPQPPSAAGRVFPRVTSTTPPSRWAGPRWRRKVQKLESASPFLPLPASGVHRPNPTLVKLPHSPRVIHHGFSKQTKPSNLGSYKGNCSDLRGSGDFLTSHRVAAKYGTSPVGRLDPLKREQLPTRLPTTQTAYCPPSSPARLRRMDMSLWSYILASRFTAHE